MQGPMLGIGKVLVAATWVFAILSFFFPVYDTSAGEYGRLLFWALLAMHTLECAVFYKPIRDAGGKPMVLQMVLVLVFGVLQYGSVRAASATSS